MEEDCNTERMSFCELYYEVVTTPKTWTEAAYHCASLGKKLVKPISEDSNRAVMTALEEAGTNTDAWIGLSNNVWTDGSALDWTNSLG